MAPYHFTVQGAATALPVQTDAQQRFVTMLQRGTLSLELYAPQGEDRQTPHTQDELYVVVSGHGEFVNGDVRHPFQAGDVLFVPAGVEHRFLNFSDDFQTWVIFYGPEGGEQAPGDDAEQSRGNMRELLTDAAARAARYLETLDDRQVFPSPEAIAALAALGGPLPAGPAKPAETLRLLDEIAGAATVASAGGRYFGFVTGGTLPAALGATMLASAWDQNAAFRVMSPAAAALEEIALGWLGELLAVPAGSAGAVVTGATMANLSGLAAARRALLLRQGWDVERDGLFGAPPLTVVVGAEVHVSVLKALGLLGLGRERVVRVPVDGQGRMRPDALPTLDDSTVLCLQAGNVNTGALDPADELCALARAAGAWVHVDGAFGLWAAASPAYASLAAGYELADSWATDAHKYLNVPYDSGVVFCRHPEHLQGAMMTGAAYLQAADSREPAHYGPELSRRARGVELWAALHSLGRAGIAELIDRTCGHARRFAEGLRVAGYLVLNEVVLNQVLVSFGDDETTRRVVELVQADGTCWAGGTTWQGQAAMRISVSSWTTTAADVERSLEGIMRVARGVTHP